MSDKEQKVAFAFCPFCEEKNPVDFREMAKGKGKNKITAKLA